MDQSDAPADTRGLDPVAICTLTSDALAERLAWVRAEIMPHVVASQPLADGLAWELRAVPELEERLDRLIALEADCCRGIRFEQRPGSTLETLRLEVHGADPRAVLHALAIGEPAAADSSRPGLLARCLGAGAAAGLFVCCVLPMLFGAVGGAALAAPLASLDRPLPIALAVIVGARLAWWWKRRSING